MIRVATFANHVAMPKKQPTSDLDRMAGLRLKAVREAWDEQGVLNQEWFASKIGVARTALANWENGSTIPDVRAMVRLYLVFGIPLEWIYLGQLRHVAYDLAARLEQRAAELGAVVGGPEAEWPMAVERETDITGVRRRPAAVPRVRRNTLHEPEPPNLEPSRP